MASGNRSKKAAPVPQERRVSVTLELATDLTISELRRMFARGGHGSSSSAFVIRQAQFNVVQKGSKQ